MTCPADDSTGSFQVPRDAVNAALGAMGGSSLTIAVTREHDGWDKTASTHGSLTTATVQPVGWVELSTVSTEAATIQGCPVPGETMCPDGCFDLSSDPLHCGSCTVICGTSQSCVQGQCTTASTTDCGTCETTADQGTCASAFSSCTADPSCSQYGTCASGCTAGDTMCLSNCEAQSPSGYSEFVTYEACICDTACPTECTTECQQQL